MSNITIQAATELEFQKIIRSLENAGIPFTVNKVSDTTFPSLNQINPYAIIAVPEAYESDVASVFDKGGNKEARPADNRTEPPRKIKLWPLFLIAYSVLVTVFLFKYWYIHRITSEDKNFVYEWSLDNTYLDGKSKKTGNAAYRYVDNNYDFNFEETFSFSSSGSMIMRWYDANEDGYNEETYVFNMDGQLTATHLDTNHDGIIDNIKIVLEDGDTLRLADTNYNGFLEVIKAD